MFTDKLLPFLQKIEPIAIRPTDAQANYKKAENIKAVIFDIYGTLIISASGDIMQDSYDASMFSEALSNSGYKILVPENKLMAIHGIFEKVIVLEKQIAKDSGTPCPELNLVEIWDSTLKKAEADDLIKSSDFSNIRLFTFLFELKSNQVWPMPGLKETLDDLKTKGYPLGIVSNAQFYTPIIMNYFLYGRVKTDEFIDGFEKDLSVFSYKILKGKPDPSIYEELIEPLKKRGLKPQDVLYVGNDMLKDIYASSQVGFKTCFFAGDMRAYRLRKDQEQASKTQPDYIITSLEQLKDIL